MSALLMMTLLRENEPSSAAKMMPIPEPSGGIALLVACFTSRQSWGSLSRIESAVFEKLGLRLAGPFMTAIEPLKELKVSDMF